MMQRVVATFLVLKMALVNAKVPYLLIKYCVEFWPCGWGIAMIAPLDSLPDPHMLILFGTEAVGMRSSCCTTNDMWSRTVGGRSPRTKSTRPVLPPGGGIRPPSPDIGCFQHRSKNRKQLHCDDRHPISDQEDL
uniref:Secreted protein n=1 Tax=Timema cristinae TaxID=61476 RepID=A0A7R9D6P0_TIMCR|nr:unnamed protein product [Timema cristinae]